MASPRPKPPERGFLAAYLADFFPHLWRIGKIRITLIVGITAYWLAVRNTGPGPHTHDTPDFPTGATAPAQIAKVQLSPEAERARVLRNDYAWKLAAVQRRYNQAAQQVFQPGIWNLTTATAQLSERRQQVQAFLSVNAELARYQDPALTALHEAMTAHAVSESDAGLVLKEYGDPTQLKLETQLRGTDHQVGQLLQEYFDYSESVQGHWTRTAAGLIQFETQAASDRCLALMSRRNQLYATRAAAQKQLLELSRAPGSP